MATLRSVPATAPARGGGAGLLARLRAARLPSLVPSLLPGLVPGLVPALLSGLLAAGLLVAVAPTARADSGRMPGDFTGYAFDACDAPSQGAMDDWRRASVFSGIGIYIAGMNRACDAQPHLTRRWVTRQARKGWRLLPLVVGRQAACSPQGYYVGKRISDRRADDYARARAQGRDDARTGARAARRLGISRGSVLWFDLEHFDIGQPRCRRSALAFTSAWTRKLDDLGYRSGFYSSASSGIRMLDDARADEPGRYDLPDYLWIAEWNGKATVRSSYIGTEGWWPHRRVHQYRGGHDERHGGTRINIDSNFMSTGQGTRPGRSGAPCRVRVDFRRYPRLERGERGAAVRAAQCYLRDQGYLRGRLDDRFDKPMARSVRRMQRDRAGVPTSGVVNARTWASLLSQGRPRLVKFGSGGPAVHRLQRALNAATDARLAVDGVFSRADHRAVKAFQRRSDQPDTGVVTGSTWRSLRRGEVVGRLAFRLTLGDLLALGESGSPAARDEVPYGIGVARP